MELVSATMSAPAEVETVTTAAATLIHARAPRATAPMGTAAAASTFAAADGSAAAFAGHAREIVQRRMQFIDERRLDDRTGRWNSNRLEPEDRSPLAAGRNVVRRQRRGNGIGDNPTLIDHGDVHVPRKRRVVAFLARDS